MIRISCGLFSYHEWGGTIDCSGELVHLLKLIRPKLALSYSVDSARTCQVYNIVPSVDIPPKSPSGLHTPKSPDVLFVPFVIVHLGKLSGLSPQPPFVHHEKWSISCHISKQGCHSLQLLQPSNNCESWALKALRKENAYEVAANRLQPLLSSERNCKVTWQGKWMPEGKTCWNNTIHHKGLN